MNSLETLKQELIKQKQLLDAKGYSVAVANTNPSPSEITTAIEKINFDFSGTTATEEDVKMGKTFFSQNNEIKTGTLDFSIINNLNSLINLFISGRGSWEISIPEDINTIRPYAFYTSNSLNPTLFSKENLSIPSNIETIEERAFNYANITGLLYIPETCTSINKYAFAYSKITEAVIDGGITNSSEYAFALCPNLIKITINCNIKALPSYICNSCPVLEELIFPASLTSLKSNFITSCTTVKKVMFRSTTPPTLTSTALSYCKTATVLVPYEYYSDYFNATNYHAYSNPMVGYGEFATGASLPAQLNGFNLVWYLNLDDLKNGTNSVTTCPEAGMLYAEATEIAS